MPRLTVHKDTYYPRKTFAVWMLREARLGSDEGAHAGDGRPGEHAPSQPAEEQPRYWTIASLGDVDADVDVHGSFFEALVWLQNLRFSRENWPVIMWAMDDPYAPWLYRDHPRLPHVEVWPSEEGERTGWDTAFLCSGGFE